MDESEYLLRKTLQDESYTNAMETLYRAAEALSPSEVRDRNDDYESSDRTILKVQNDLKYLTEKGLAVESSFNRYELTGHGAGVARHVLDEDETVDNLLTGGT